VFSRQEEHPRGPFGELGFTLIELLTVIMLTSILMGLAAFELRHFWFVRALAGSENEVATQLRRQQQRVIAETHPLVYGARFPKGGSAERASWSLIRFNAGNLTTTTDDTCVQYQTISLGSGVRIKNSNSRSEGVGFDDASYVTDFCRDNLETLAGAPVSSAQNDHLAFFFARGNATEGQVTLEQTQLGRTETICIAGLTGRTYERDSSHPCPT
jgi:prepilin-type N-terminal cleavage/methylation domain-containing protein